MPNTKKAHFIFKSVRDYPNYFPNKYLHLVNMGYENCPPKYQFTNSFNYYRIYFIKSGSGTLTIDNTVYRLSQHDVFLIRPNQLITKKADSQTPWEYCFFAFNGELSEEIVNQTYFQDNNCVYTLKDDTLSQLILDATYRMQTPYISNFGGLEQLFRFLRTLSPPSLEDDFVFPAQSSTLSQKHCLAAQEYIEINYYKPIQVKDICEAINVSRSYLFRIFEKHTASNVTDYLINIRLKHAKDMLLNTDYSTAAIAQSVGYINATSFYRMFKKVEKVTPSEWRTNHKK